MINVRGGIRRLSAAPVAGLAWLVWRRHRVAFRTALALAALAAIWGVRQHVQLVDAVQAWVTECPPSRPLPPEGPSVCFQAPGAVDTVMSVAAAPLRYLPVAVGALLGAPLFAQSLQDGTQRLAWTQSVSRRQWAAAKLCVGGAVTAVAALLVTAPVTWWWYTIRHGNTEAGPLGTAWRDMASPGDDWSYLPYTGPAGVAHLLLALAAGAAVGLLLRRVLAAVAASAAVVLAFQYGLEKLRPHLLTPAISRTPRELFPDRPANGWHVDRGYTYADGSRTSNFPCSYEQPWEGLQRCVRTHHITGSYSRDFTPRQFLPLQWIETGICVTATALLVALCLVHVQRMRIR